jgi:hypothetical protein
MGSMFSRFCLPLMLVAFASELSATQTKPLTIEDLTKKSDCVVHGAVLSTTVRRDSAGRIYTTVELAVVEHWRGNGSANRFTLLHAGGVLGEKGVTVIGQEQFSVGEEVVVFTARNKRGEAITVGMAQGKFIVARDKQSGRVHVSNSVHHTKDGPLTLEQLKQRVKGAAR